MPASTRPTRPSPANELVEDAGRALLELARTLWAWRLELAALGVVAGAYLAATTILRPVPAAVLTAVLAAGVTGFARTPLRSASRRSRTRRRWSRAWSATTNPDGRPVACPRVRSVSVEPAGLLLQIRVRRGQSVAVVEQRARQLASELRAMRCEVRQDKTDASRASVLVRKRDPLETNSDDAFRFKRVSGVLSGTTANPSLWSPIPVGVDERGGGVTLSLPGKNLLVGGEPEAGKSATLSLLIAAAALSRTRLYIIDGGEADGAFWAPVADALVGADRKAAISLLERLSVAVDKRRTELVRRGIRKVTEADADWAPLGLLVIDELPYFLNGGAKDERELFADLLRDLIARSRKVGLITVLSAQRPAADTVPASIRDLCGYRFALRCATKDASDTVLGRGWASEGFDASTIPAVLRGCGYLLTDGSRPQRIRTFWMDDDELRATVDAAISVRLETESLTGSPDGRIPSDQS